MLNFVISMILVAQYIFFPSPVFQNLSKTSKLGPIGIRQWESLDEDKHIEVGLFDKKKGAIEVGWVEKLSPTTRCHNDDQFVWNTIK